MKIVLFANTDWYLYNFRLSLASALRDAGYDLLLISPPGLYGNKLRAQGLRWMEEMRDSFCKTKMASHCSKLQELSILSEFD